MFHNLPLSTLSLSQIRKTHKRYNFDRAAIAFSITVYAQIGKYTSNNIYIKVQAHPGFHHYSKVEFSMKPFLSPNG